MYFPRPYPDEPTLSLFIRAARHLGYPIPRLLREMLHADPRGASFTLPFSIADASRLTKIPCNDLMLGHTFFPYVTAFFSLEKATATFESVVEGSSVAYTHFGFLAGSKRNRFHVRFCPRCVAENIEQFGEAYWHRKHALPGVLICTAHDLPLLTANMLAGTVDPRNCDHLPSDTPGNVVKLLLNHDLVREIAVASQELLDGRRFDVGSLVARYQQLLDLFGGDLANPRTIDHPVYTALRSFYGNAYLNETNFVWLRGLTIVRNRARPTPTLPAGFGFTSHKHILLNILLDHLLATQEDSE